MPSIDSRVVQMQFRGEQFANGIKSTLSALDSLKQKLDMKGAGAGLENLNKSTRGFNLNPMVSSIGQVTSSFSAMQVAGVTALSTLVNKAVNAGTAMAKSLTIAPVTGGLKEYETKLGSIQTILSNTQAAGTNLKDVTGALEELNKYSDQTIYNFGEMARNIGTFTAAGVNLETATSSIKGIANLAALSGSTSQQASTAMYQLSQAISAGTVSMMDWKSVENAGMGGAVFQRSLAETAVAMGKLDAGAVKLTGDMKNVTVNGESFRRSISSENGPSWLSSDVLTTALGNFTGDLSKADLVAQGFSASAADGILKQAQAAKDAATIVKTGSQLMGTLRESAESGWASTWEIIIGDFNQAKVLWTGVSKAIGGILDESSTFRNNTLTAWKNMGGRAAVIDGIRNAFNALMAVIRPIKEAFREIFPAKTGAQLAEMSKNFRDFTAGLKIGGETAKNLKQTFAGIFAVFSIILQVVKAAVGVFFDLFKEVGKGSGGFLEFTAGIGAWLQKVDKALKDGQVFTKIFEQLGKVLALPLALIKEVARWVGNLFEGMDAGGVSRFGDAFDGAGKKIKPVQEILKRLGTFFKGLGDSMKNIGVAVGKVLGNVGDAIADSFGKINWDRVLDIIDTGLLAGIVLLLKNFTSGGLVSIDMGGGLVDSIKETLGGVTDSLKNMQQSIKADMLLKIAGALALLTASIVVLAMVDGDDLSRSLKGMGIGFLGLSIGLAALSKTISIIGATKLPFIAAAMVLMAGAMLILATALKIMSTMSWDELARGLVGLGGALVIIGGAMRLMPKNMLAQAAAITALGIALNLIAIAMKVMGTLSWAELGKGIAGFAAALVTIALAMRLMPKGMLLQAAALNILAVALNAIFVAIRLFATMDMATLGQGLLGIAGALGLIAAAMHLMPANLILQAAGLVAVGVALNLISIALKIMGGMSWDAIGKGLVTLGGALAILAVGLHAMNGTLVGSAALLVASGALTLLLPVLVGLGAMSWESIAKGLTALAGAFVVLGVAGAVLGPLVPVILGLSAAVLIIGAGFALAGVGALAFATALGILAVGGAAAVAVLSGILETVIKAIPGVLKAVGTGIVEFAKVIGKGAKAIVEAIAKIMMAILEKIVEYAPRIVESVAKFLLGMLKKFSEYIPKIITAIADLIVKILNALTNALPRIIDAGARLIIALLTGITRNISKIVTAAVDLIIAFVNGIANNIGRIIQAGADLIIKFINGVANAIRSNSAALNAAGRNLADAIVDGMISGLASGLKSIANKAAEIARGALNAAKSVLGIKSPSKEFEKIGKFVNEGFVKGLTSDKSTSTETYNKMKALIGEAMKAAKEDVTELEKRLATLHAAKKKDIAAIKETQAALAEARKEVVATTAANSQMGKHLVDEQRKMTALAGAYSAVATKLDAANKVLEDARKTRDDYAKSVKDQYDNLPDITADTKLQTAAEKGADAAARHAASSARNAEEADRAARAVERETAAADKIAKLREEAKDPNLSEYERGVRSRAAEREAIASQRELDALAKVDAAAKAKAASDLAASEASTAAATKEKMGVAEYISIVQAKGVEVAKFAALLQRLRDMGLNDTTYGELLAKGVDAMPFMEKLAALGTGSITELNKATATLTAEAAKLGNNASKALYQAGVDAALGIVKGLNSQSSVIVKQMEALARIMLTALKKALGIKSPSREFAKLGAYSAQGMADGMREGSSNVATAADYVANEAVSRMKSTLEALSTAMSGEVDLNPTITPVLDLSSVQRTSGELNRLLDAKSINTVATFSDAQNASSGYNSNKSAALSQSEKVSSVEKHFQFIQNNNSPKALSPAEIYRQTKNQLSVAKGALV